MSDTVQVALIAGLPSIIASTVSIINLIRSTFQHKETKEKLTALQDSTNGKMDKLLAVTSKASFAEGVKSEKDKE